MSSDGNAAAAGTVTKAPTVQEANFMFAVLENHEGPLKINWEGVAASMGLKNGSTASVRFGQIKKKLGWNSTGAGRGSNRVIKTRSPAKPRGKSAPAKNGTAKAKPRAAKAKVPSSKVDAEDDDEEEGGNDKQVVDLMNADEDSEEEVSFEAKVNRGDYDSDEDDGQLSDGALEQLQKEYAQQGVQQEVEYDAYDPDAVFEDAEEGPEEGEQNGGGAERQLYVPKHR